VKTYLCYEIFTAKSLGPGLKLRYGLSEGRGISDQEVEFGGMDWIELAKDRDRRWALVNAIMNFGVP
jgi:hypothetical protein